MARSEQRRQQKLLKKRGKDKLRRDKAKGSHFAAASEYYLKKSIIKKAAEFPLYECLIGADWQEIGLARILVARKQSNGKIVFGTYLVDVFCLGLKNTFCNAELSLIEYEDSLKEGVFEATRPISCHIGLARRIIYGGIDYAQGLGFKPNKDFKLSRDVLGPPSEVDMGFEVSFGKDGKPFYIAGPDDDASYVLRKLGSHDW